MRNSLILITILLFVSLFLQGQNNQTRVRFDFPQLNRGEVGNISSIYQDYQGYLWIGQDNGLWQFNGYSYKRIPLASEVPGGISNNNITCIFEDSDSLLWIATRGGGLNLYNRNTEDFRFFVNDVSDSTSLSFNDVFTVYEDDFGDIWVGTDGGGLNKLNKDTFTFSQILDPADPESSSAEKVLSIYRDKENEVYIGTWGNGLKKINLSTGKWEDLIPETDKLPIHSRKNVWIINKFSLNKLLLGTFGEGAIIYDRNDNTFEKITNITDPIIYSVQKTG